MFNEPNNHEEAAQEEERISLIRVCARVSVCVRARACCVLVDSGNVDVLKVMLLQL